jgi:2'-5' RNA ligase
MKIAILIELDKNTKKEIINWKKKFKNSFRKIKYIDDTPHLTLIVSQVRKDKKKIEELNNFIKKQINKFDIIFQNSNAFYNDKLTGGDTFFVNVKKSKELKQTQLKIVNFISTNFQLINLTKISNLNKKENLNYKKYGFPYVCENWIPHVSIGCILDKKKNNNELINNFLHYKFYQKIKVNCISINMVLKSKLKLIKKIKF